MVQHKSRRNSARRFQPKVLYDQSKRKIETIEFIRYACLIAAGSLQPYMGRLSEFSGPRVEEDGIFIADGRYGLQPA